MYRSPAIMSRVPMYVDIVVTPSVGQNLEEKGLMK